jgi:hypothetical protein
MVDPIEALKGIRTLATVGSETDDPKLMLQHLEMIMTLADKALTPPKVTPLRPMGTPRGH